MVDLVVEKADDEAEDAADKEADGIFEGAVIFDIDHDQFKNADHGQDQTVQAEGERVFVKAGDDAQDGEQEQADADKIISRIVGVQNADHQHRIFEGNIVTCPNIFLQKPS